MKVRWEVEDGYVGGARPQYTEVPDEELNECVTGDEREELIQDYVSEDFARNITWVIKSQY